MKQDQWTQQLREKLVEHETAAPEGLWADIEAALSQQAGSAARQPRSRFVVMRRWAVAASIVALLFGGGFLWWMAQQPSSLQVQKTASLPSSAVERLDAQPETPTPLDERITTVLEVRQIASRFSVSSDTTAATVAVAVSSFHTSQDPLPSHSSQESLPSQPSQSTQELRPQRQSPMLSHHTSSDPKKRSQPALSLYAMNGFGNENSTHGVQMADALAQRYMATFENSYSAAARSSEPIWLTDYEERQHHHRPVAYGLTLDYPLTDRLSLSTGLVYTKLSSDFTQVMRRQQIQQEQTLHYVGVPLVLRCRLWTWQNFRAYFSAGTKVDWNVATHLETEGVRQHLPKDRLQWSLNTSLGVQYDILPQLGLYAEPALNWYPDNGSTIQNYFKDQPLSLGLQVGLRLNLR